MIRFTSPKTAKTNYAQEHYININIIDCFFSEQLRNTGQTTRIPGFYADRRRAYGCSTFMAMDGSDSGR